MAAAGLGDDLLLANQVVGRSAERLGALVKDGRARVTVAAHSSSLAGPGAFMAVRPASVPDAAGRGL